MTSKERSTGSLRKRVTKACDNCRMRKCKCDGELPCSRCKAENRICAFERKRKASQPRIYPEGYCDILEEQQTQLVDGLGEMYRRLRRAGAWDGCKLPETNGRPLVHDILVALNLPRKRPEDESPRLTFEENCESLQAKLVEYGSSSLGYTSCLSPTTMEREAKCSRQSLGTPVIWNEAPLVDDRSDVESPGTSDRTLCSNTGITGILDLTPTDESPPKTSDSARWLGDSTTFHASCSNSNIAESALQMADRATGTLCPPIPALHFSGTLPPVDFISSAVGDKNLLFNNNYPTTITGCPLPYDDPLFYQAEWAFPSGVETFQRAADASLIQGLGWTSGHDM